MRVVRIVGKTSLRIGAVLLSLGIFVLAGRILLGGTEVRAAMDTYYPQFCLGGWDHPRSASGEPDTYPGDDESAFTTDNSAFLASDVSAQIFCGYFPVETRTNPPVSATVRLVWNLAGADAMPSPIAPSSSETIVAPETKPASQDSTSSPASVSPDATTSENETDTGIQSESPPPSATPIPAPLDATATPESAPTTSAVETPGETSPADPTPTDATPAPAADPAPASVPAADTTSFIYEASHVAGTWFLSHTRTAHAQEDTSSSVAISLSDWFLVSYSLDGVRWKSIGRVNASNWRDFTATIPLSSWDDLQNVQIMVSALPSLTDRPPVYLDAMELRVETDATFAESAAAAVGTASDVLDSAINAVLSLLPGEKEPAATVISVEPPAPQPAPIARTKKRVLQFTVHGEPVPAYTRLPWQNEDVRDNLASTTQTSVPDIARSDDGRSFIVSGSCSSAYAVVIAYPEADDYREHPRNALVNVATPCESGHYTFNLGLLPDSTRSGTLYLLIGAQGETGTWTPASALIPITIDPIEIEQ